MHSIWFFNWWLEAAEQGHAMAQGVVGGLFESGVGVKQDYNEAMKWFLKAAEQGNASAQFNIGIMYQSGKGIPKDEKEAMKWFLQAAEQGNSDANRMIKVMHEHGDGVPKDFKEAMKHGLKAAERGSSMAQLELGNMYSFGAHGAPKDFSLAYMWFKLASSDLPQAAAICEDLEKNLTPSQIEEGKRLVQEWLAKHKKK